MGEHKPKLWKHTKKAMIGYSKVFKAITSICPCGSGKAQHYCCVILDGD